MKQDEKKRVSILVCQFIKNIKISSKKKGGNEQNRGTTTTTRTTTLGVGRFVKIFFQRFRIPLLCMPHKIRLKACRNSGLKIV